MISPVAYPKMTRTRSDVGVHIAPGEIAGAKAQAPEPGLGGVCRQVHPRLSLLQTLQQFPEFQFVTGARESVGEDLRDQSQPGDQRVRPVARRAQGIEAEGANGWFTAHGERETQRRSDTQRLAGAPIDSRC